MEVPSPAATWDFSGWCILWQTELQAVKRSAAKCLSPVTDLAFYGRVAWERISEAQQKCQDLINIQPVERVVSVTHGSISGYVFVSCVTPFSNCRTSLSKA